jgi:uncharacterized membrane protein YfcA
MLLAFGMPAIQANATSTLALMVGMAGSLYGYRTHLPAARPWLKVFAPASIVGGFVGAWLLTRTSAKVFDQLVPFLILFATILFFLNNAIRRLAGIEAGGGSVNACGSVGAAIAGVVLQFAVAVYGGYFGAGIGILMLATMGLLGLHHIHKMNAIKTILGALINVVASAYFLWSGLVIWPQAIVMTVGSAIGYFLGSHFSQRISQQQVRTIIGLVGLSLSILFFWKQFFYSGVTS